MYNIGFGDCFLLTFPAADRPRKMLIDCGVHFMGKNKEQPFDLVLEQLIKDVTEEGKPKIDIVVATHRHQDHVSGFENEIWNEVEVTEVWMPWTENYKDKQAVEILNKQSRRAKKINLLLTGMLDNPTRFGLNKPEQVKEVQEIKDFSENSLTNVKAMNMLHHGFKGGDSIKRRYLPDRDRALNTFESDHLPGVTAYIMGPSFDKEVIRDMDPPENEQWFRMMEAKTAADCVPEMPFHAGWSQMPDENPNVEALLSKRDRRTISRVGDDTAFAVAKALENSVNGTSLMMMLKIGEAHLFFPGDAQHGTWQSALKDEEWRKLLTKTNFYKVGHHGSHNATPKEFINEVIQPKCRAMISVYPVKIFEDIPKETMLTAMTEREAEYVRSDKAVETGDPETFIRNDLFVDTFIDI